MDTPEQSDQVMQKLSGIESQLRSLRYTFGIGIIILAVFLTLLVPALIRDFSSQSMWGAPRMMDASDDWAPTVREGVNDALPEQATTPGAATTTAATTTP